MLGVISLLGEQEEEQEMDEEMDESTEEDEDEEENDLKEWKSGNFASDLIKAGFTELEEEEEDEEKEDHGKG